MANSNNDNCITCTLEQGNFNFRVKYEDYQHTCEKGSGTTKAGGSSAYTFDNYQEDTGITAIYPEAGTGSTNAITYCVLGLIGEAGEIANKWKKVLRDSAGVADLETLDTILDEDGDVLWYVSQLAAEINYRLGDDYKLGGIAANNIRKLSSRQTRGKLSGSGDDR